MNDWYNLTKEDIDKFGGRGLLNEYFNSSPSQALQEIYPEHKWELWRFGHTPKGCWKKYDNQRQFFMWLGIQLGYKQLDDWYKLTKEDISRYGGVGLLEHLNGSNASALVTLFPEHDWMLWKFGCKTTNCWKSQSTQRQFFDWLVLNTATDVETAQ